MHLKLPTSKYRRREDITEVFYATQNYQPILGIIQNLTPEVINTNYLTSHQSPSKERPAMQSIMLAITSNYKLFAENKQDVL